MTAPSSGPPGRIGGLRARHLLTAAEWAVALSASLVMIWPVTAHLGTRIVGATDAEYYLWQGWRLGRMLFTGDMLRLRIPDIVYPYGADLRVNEGLLPSIIGGIWNLAAPPILAYNLALLTAILLNFWAARRLAKLFSKRRTVWVLTGLAYATAPPVALRLLGHFTLAFAFTVPLVVAEAVRVARGASIRPLRLAGLWFLAYLCSIYFFLFGAVAFSVLTAPTLVRRRPRLRVGLRLLTTGVLIILLLLPFLVPRLKLDRREQAAGSPPVGVVGSDTFSADVMSLVAQPDGSTLDLPWSRALRDRFRPGTVLEGTTFPGFLLLLALPVTFLVRSELRKRLVLAVGLLWIFCLGTVLRFGGRVLYDPDGKGVELLPFSLLLKVPGLGSLRTPNRAGFALAAVLAAGLALSLNMVMDRLERPWQRGLLGVAAGLSLLTNLFIPVRSSDFDTTRVTERALQEVARRAGPGDTTEYVPADCLLVDWMVKLQVFHRTPVVGCQTGTSAVGWHSSLDLYASSAGLAALRCNPAVIGRRATSFVSTVPLEPALLDELHRDLGVRFLIVDKRLIATKTCASLASILPVLEKYRTLGEDDRFLIVDTRAPVFPTLQML